jgi:hypothetical protein
VEYIEGAERTETMEVESVGPARGGDWAGDAEEGQVAIAPTRYMAVKRTTVTTLSDTDSEQQRPIEKNAIIVVSDTKIVGDMLRLRFARGWTSAYGPAGRTFFIAENSPTRHFHALRDCVLRADFEHDSEKVGTLNKNAVVEAIEVRKDAHGRVRLRFEDGWASELIGLLTEVKFSDKTQKLDAIHDNMVVLVEPEQLPETSKPKAKPQVMGSPASACNPHEIALRQC